MIVGDGDEGDEGSAVMSGGEGACVVVKGWVRGIVAGSLELSESSGKTSHTVFRSFSMSLSIRLSLWSAWKEKGSGGDEAVSWPRFWNGFVQVIVKECSVCVSVMVCKLFY